MVLQQQGNKHVYGPKARKYFEPWSQRIYWTCFPWAILNCYIKYLNQLLPDRPYSASITFMSMFQAEGQQTPMEKRAKGTLIDKWLCSVAYLYIGKTDHKIRVVMDSVVEMRWELLYSVMKLVYLKWLMALAFWILLLVAQINHSHTIISKIAEAMHAKIKSVVMLGKQSNVLTYFC